MTLDSQALLFFSGHEGALPLYRAADACIRAAVGDVRVKIQKTQISYYSRRLFACVSFLPVKRAAERPRNFITLTLGLPCRLDSPRVAAACEPYPGRWTHHFLLTDPGEIDDELICWIRQAAAFGAAKK